MIDKFRDLSKKSRHELYALADKEFNLIFACVNGCIQIEQLHCTKNMIIQFDNKYKIKKRFISSADLAHNMRIAELELLLVCIYRAVSNHLITREAADIAELRLAIMKKESIQQPQFN